MTDTIPTTAAIRAANMGAIASRAMIAATATWGTTWCATWGAARNETPDPTRYRCTHRRSGQ
ncbi:MAG: hypothetical protein ACYDEF_17495 [Methanosarcina sp.]